MKRIPLITALLFYCAIFSQNNQRPQSDQFNFVPGKFIVKLKDNVKTKISFNSQGKGTSNINIGNLLEIKSKIKKQIFYFQKKQLTEASN